MHCQLFERRQLRGAADDRAQVAGLVEVGEGPLAEAVASLTGAARRNSRAAGLKSNHGIVWAPSGWRVDGTHSPKLKSGASKTSAKEASLASQSGTDSLTAHSPDGRVCERMTVFQACGTIGASREVCARSRAFGYRAAPRADAVGELSRRTTLHSIVPLGWNERDSARTGRAEWAPGSASSRIDRVHAGDLHACVGT